MNKLEENIHFQKNHFGWWILVIKDEKTKKKLEKLMMLGNGNLHECSDCGQIHPLKTKWWLRNEM